MIRKIIPLLILLLLSGCAITHKYGPYRGKVIDKDTSQPIEGAVVFMRFYTVGLFATHNFADAVEVLTDQDGEFHIPAQRLNAFRPLNGWESYGSPIIFKPGYGAYPGHPEISIDIDPPGLLPEGRHVTVKLPRLKTKEERKRYLSDAGAYDPTVIPLEKQTHILRLYNKERVYLNLNPIMTE